MSLWQGGLVEEVGESGVGLGEEARTSHLQLPLSSPRLGATDHFTTIFTKVLPSTSSQ